MRKTVSALFLAAVVVATLAAPVVHALPDASVAIDYWDCAGNWNGVWWIACNGARGSSGTLNGKYRSEEYIGCHEYSWEIYWYENVNGEWVPLSGPPNWGC